MQAWNKLILTTNGSFRSHQTCNSNDQYSLIVVMLYLFQYCSVKMSINRNSQHLFQMVSRISRPLNLDQKFLAKRCVLYASFYRNNIKQLTDPLLYKSIMKTWTNNRDQAIQIREDNSFFKLYCWMRFKHQKRSRPSSDFLQSSLGSKDGTVVRALASHQCVLG